MTERTAATPKNDRGTIPDALERKSWTVSHRPERHGMNPRITSPSGLGYEDDDSTKTSIPGAQAALSCGG
ncbi:MAG TPA: hypothetical protein VNS34_04495 [Rhizobiaceae bacterium]|nr:hypothetical protein [Rhizobiaceae bacterium]